MGLDADSNIIKKSDFLQQLTSGHFVPFKIMVRNNVPYYKLYPVSNSRSDIKETIKQVTAAEIVHFNKEGQSLPAFNFTDITGKTYTPATTKGKVMVLKCWFIGCVPCVQEFPEVNKLVEGYKDRNDILFISLAIDKKSHLVNFLKAHDLKYATMPDMGDYMHDKLGIGSYPTHLLIDRAGKIVKVVNRIDELKPFLDKQAATSL